MKKVLLKNKILAIIAVIGLLASIVPLFSRVKAEENTKSYDMVLNYTGLKAMAEQSELSENDWLQIFREKGFSSIVLDERNLLTAGQTGLYPIKTVVGKEYKEGKRPMDFPQAVLDWIESADQFDAAVIFENEEALEWAEKGYEERYGLPVEHETLELAEGECWLIKEQSNGLTGHQIVRLSLGCWPGEKEAALASGMNLMLRTNTVEGLNGVRFTESYMRALGDSVLPYFWVDGDALLGEDEEESLQLTLDYIKKNNMKFCLAESDQQFGNQKWDNISDVYEAVDRNAIRCFKMWNFIRNRYQYCGYESGEEITNSLFRAIAERNCKLIEFNTILYPDNKVYYYSDQSQWTFVTDPQVYIDVLDDLDRRLGAIGYTREEPSAMDYPDPPEILRMLEGFGVVAIGVMILDNLFDIQKKKLYLLFIMGSALFAVIAVRWPDLYKLGLSISGGIVCPALSIIAIVKKMSEVYFSADALEEGCGLKYCMGTGLSAVLIAFCGSVMVAGALSELSFEMEISVYRGVKVMQLIPIMFFAFCYLYVFLYERQIKERGLKKFSEDLKAQLHKPKDASWYKKAALVVLILIALAAVGYYYMKRTGNSTNVPKFELWARNQLENLLIARPRTKEILIGWPCLMLFIWACRKRIKYLPLFFGLGMSIGMVNLVNTFLHIHTNLLLSLLRSFWGLLIGFILGAIAVAVVNFIWNKVKRFFPALQHSGAEQ